ncbi:hypothetical protein MHA_0753 [Mannheimia haemolytica PHL213]|nr:hypothetical protein MHA_0753 [Mannheimia haemolytica PHL213]
MRNRKTSLKYRECFAVFCYSYTNLFLSFYAILHLF